MLSFHDSWKASWSRLLFRQIGQYEQATKHVAEEKQ